MSQKKFFFCLDGGSVVVTLQTHIRTSTQRDINIVKLGWISKMRENICTWWLTMVQ